MSAIIAAPYGVLRAENTPMAKAQHIKIGENVEKTVRSHGINIQSGAMPDRADIKAQAKARAADKQNGALGLVTLTTPQKANDMKKVNLRAKSITTRPFKAVKPCPFEIGYNTLAAKHLAGSLRFYMKDQGYSDEAVTAMYDASAHVGVDFGVMAVSAWLESNLGRNTVSKTSSARGMFQFIDSTWLILIKEYGKRIGLSAESDSIYLNEKTGKLEIVKSSRITRESILAIRNDVRIASLIKAYQIKDEENALKELGVTKISITDYYIAHMLGVGLAKELYDRKHSKSSKYLSDSKTSRMREAARLNPYFFYAGTGSQPLTAAQSYKRFETRIARAIRNIRNIEDEYGIGENSALFRPACPAK